jgi:uncharacterized membrane protein YhdT
MRLTKGDIWAFAIGLLFMIGWLYVLWRFG